MRVFAHGGAGTGPDRPRRRRRRLAAAVDAGVEATSPLEAVCTTIRSLETDPAFNAGIGSAVQSDGSIRTDAGLMTADRRCGAVAGLEGVAHPIDAARAVLRETPHVLLAGEAATEFAAASGVATDVDCWSARTRDRWADDGPAGISVTEQLDWLEDHFGGTDTVGAIATDGNRLAVGTSTGGRWGALAGRVGDVPQVGAGFYATAAGGASATGAGEAIARTGLARLAVGLLADGYTPDRAASEAIDRFGDLADGSAGVIVMDDSGATGSAFDSPAMQTATTASG